MGPDKRKKPMRKYGSYGPMVCKDCGLEEDHCECHLWTECHRCGEGIEKEGNEFILDKRYYCPFCIPEIPERYQTESD